MRPVDKGAAPAVYANYQDAGPDLQACLGDYCSYCERQIETHLAVEHIQPKSRRRSLRNAWSNFLLACVHCNSSKGKKQVNVVNYLWPDSDNTLRALEYVRGGLIQPSPPLPAAIRGKAQATIDLTGFDKDPGHPNAARRPTRSDQRWLRRQQTWAMAERCRAMLLANDSPEVRDLITQVAAGRGGFSIWWTAFAGDVDMRRKLREAFLGTHGGCFDVNEDLVARAGGQV